MFPIVKTMKYSFFGNQLQNEDEYLYQSVYFLAKCFFFGFEVNFNPIQSLPLFFFQECSERYFAESLIYYCDCIDFCDDFIRIDEGIAIFLEHFLIVKTFSYQYFKLLLIFSKNYHKNKI
jgi:hypothetical protein